MNREKSLSASAEKRKGKETEKAQFRVDEGGF